MAAEALKLLCVFPHPDDEALGCGFALSKYAAEGVEIHLVTATRGERGWSGIPPQNPGLEAMGRLREAELLCAAQALGIRQVHFLDYIDGDVDQADPLEISARIAEKIRLIRPQVVVTFDPTGAYGHPDHISLTQFTQAGVLRAADSRFQDAQNQAAYQVPKLYYLVDSQPLVDLVTRLTGGIAMEIDGVTRRHTGWVDWAITTQVDGSAYWEQGVKAIACHASQVQDILPLFQAGPESYDRRIFSVQNFVRVYSLVNGGRTLETDLFEGLR